jgi:hypothetical protein
MLLSAEKSSTLVGKGINQKKIKDSFRVKNGRCLKESIPYSIVKNGGMSYPFSENCR